MKIEEYIDNWDEVIKEIEDEVYDFNCKINLCIWSIAHGDSKETTVETHLYIHLETDTRWLKDIDCAWVLSIGSFEIEKLKHRKALNDFKNDIYKVLKSNFKNVKIIDHND